MYHQTLSTASFTTSTTATGSDALFENSNGDSASKNYTHRRRPSSRSNSSTSPPIVAKGKRRPSLSRPAAAVSSPPTPVSAATTSSTATVATKKSLPPSPSRRRSRNAAHVAAETVASPQIKDGIGNLNRWSQSTASSITSTSKDGNQHNQGVATGGGSGGGGPGSGLAPSATLSSFFFSSSPSYSPKRLSLTAGASAFFSSVHGHKGPASTETHPQSPQLSPSRKQNQQQQHTADSRPSPSSSPKHQRHSRPHSPAPVSKKHRANPMTTLPPLSTLSVLPASTYSPSDSPSSSIATVTPSTAGFHSPSTHATSDYFSPKPRSSSTNSARHPGGSFRGKSAPSPLSTPPILGYDPVNAGHHRPTRSSSSRPSTADTGSRPNTANQRQPASTPHYRERRGDSRDAGRRKRRDSESSSGGHRAAAGGTGAAGAAATAAAAGAAGGTVGGGLGDDSDYTTTPPRNRERRERDKKTMLSRALQKANTAVLLDNAQNFEGAMEAYEDACRLLTEVMLRSSGEDDKRKLDAIRTTYTNRILELRTLDPTYQYNTGRPLPARPVSEESVGAEPSQFLKQQNEEEEEEDEDGAEGEEADEYMDEEPVIISTATVTRIVNDGSVPGNGGTGVFPMQSKTPSQPPQIRESVIGSAIRDIELGINLPSFGGSSSLPEKPAEKEAVDDGSQGDRVKLTTLTLPMDKNYMPPPLSPRRPVSPNPPPPPSEQPPPPPRLASLDAKPSEHLAPPHQKHVRAVSSESVSWLDTIDESGGSSSCSSSVHSLDEVDGIRRRHIRTGSGNTENEFDAALDAAVEAAYDDGLEPYEADDSLYMKSDVVASALRNVELAKEKVREIERQEAISRAKMRQRELAFRERALPHVRESSDDLDFEGDDAEEERMLDEMTREYMLHEFDFDLPTRTTLPRESDSSNVSGGTLSSAASSKRATNNDARAALSTVEEASQPATPQSAPMPTHQPPPPPVSATLPSVLPTSPSSNASSTPRMSQSTSPPPTLSGLSALALGTQTPSVRERRRSSNIPKRLTIETSVTKPIPPPPQTPQSSDAALPAPPGVSGEIPPAPKTASSVPDRTEPTFKIPTIPASQQSGLRTASPQFPGQSPADSLPPTTPALTQTMSHDPAIIPSSPGSKFPGKSSGVIKKNKSSLSLKGRSFSISSPDGSEVSATTPMSAAFPNVAASRKQGASVAAHHALPTPGLPPTTIDATGPGGLHLFESDIHSPYSPGSPNPSVINGPIPLEPCPESHLLRPFWLMRAVYQTIAHPRGGYITNKLFVPRDVWRVKGVKIKALEEKVAKADLLTAALMKLAAVDTFDADAMMVEMQSLEIVLDEVQAALVKKLGNEVGMQGASALFKDATSTHTGSDAATDSGHLSHKTSIASSSGKAYLSSWRKLRSKNSTPGLSGPVSSSSSLASAAGAAQLRDLPRETLTMQTLPMTSLTKIRFAKRDVASVEFSGPNAEYMACLARLFDAAQVLDQITRQVEDPGLKGSGKTYVGLELSARHAAEFFGFFICRFVMADLTALLDKFIKRSSEWVLV